VTVELISSGAGDQPMDGDLRPVPVIS